MDLRGGQRRYRWWTCAAMLALGAAAADATELKLAGSDLLGAEFAAAVKKFAQQNEQPVTLSLEGSRAALARLQAGEADIGLIVVPPGEEPPGEAFRSFPLAYHVAIVLVPESSPLSQITYRELGGIFGATEATSFTRWGDIGLSGAWSSRAIAPQAMGPGAGLASELFRRLVLGEGKLRTTVVLQPAFEAVRKKLETEEGSIAVAGMVPAELKTVRVLPVAKAEHDVAFGPSAENVHAGDYPLRLPVWLVVRRESGRVQLNFLRFLLSDDVAPLLERAGLVMLPLQARNQLVFDLEQL